MNFSTDLFEANNSNICNETLQLLSKRFFLVILSLEIAAAPLGIVGNFLILIAVYRTTVFHNNFRLLLAHLSLISMFYCTAAVSRPIYALITIGLGDQCKLVVSMYACKLQDLALVLPLNNIMYAILSIGCERFYATIRRNHYDHGRSVVIGIFLLCLTWSVAIGFQVSSIPRIPKISTPFCVNILVVTKSTALMMLVFNISQECVGLLLYACTYILNRSLYVRLLINKASGHSLTGRFQMAQNMQVCAFMLPSVLVHTACWIPANAFVALVVAGMNLEFIQKVEMVHTAYLLAMVYCVVHPIIIFSLNLKLRNNLFKALPDAKVSPDCDNGRQPRLEPAAAASAAPTLSLWNKSKYTVGPQDHFDIMLKTWTQVGTKTK